MSSPISTTKKPPLERIIKCGLGLFLFLLPWQTIWITKEQFINGGKWEYGTLGVYATEILLGWCALLFIIWQWREIKNKKATGQWHFAWTPDRYFVVVCAAFIGYTFCSILWSIDRAVAWQHALWVMEAFLLFFMLTVTYQLPAISYKLSFIAGSIIQSALGIWQFLSQTTFSSTLLGLAAHPAWQAGTSIISTVHDGRWLRAYGAFSHPNVFGGYLVISLIITDLFILEKTKKNCISCNMKHVTCNKCYMLHVTCFIIITALFFTFSRSAWLAAIVWSIGYAVFIRNKSFIIYRLALIIILSTIFFPLLTTRLKDSTINEVRSITERVSGYNEAFTVWKNQPWRGVGIGNATAALVRAMPNRPAWEYQPAHNVPLLMLTELGIVGVLLALIIILFSCNIKHVARNNCYMLSVACFMIIAIFDHYLLSSYTGLLLTATAFAFSLSPDPPLSIPTLL